MSNSKFANKIDFSGINMKDLPRTKVETKASGKGSAKKMGYDPKVFVDRNWDLLAMHRQDLCEKGTLKQQVAALHHLLGEIQKQKAESDKLLAEAKQKLLARKEAELRAKQEAELKAFDNALLELWENPVELPDVNYVSGPAPENRGILKHCESMPKEEIGNEVKITVDDIGKCLRCLMRRDCPVLAENNTKRRAAIAAEKAAKRAAERAAEIKKLQIETKKDAEAYLARQRKEALARLEGKLDKMITSELKAKPALAGFTFRK